MDLTLAMDAAAGGGTLALLRDGALIAERSVVMRSENEERFFPAVLDLLHEANVELGALSRIVVGAGPGSFTALRVVGATAKGLAQAKAIPLFCVPSLALIVAGDARTAADGAVPPRESTRYLATLDALRGERYAALVELNERGDVQQVTQLGLIAIADLDTRAAEFKATVIGPEERMEATPHARGVARCLALVEHSGAVDLASWEPMYGRLAEAQVKWEAAHGRALG